MNAFRRARKTTVVLLVVAFAGALISGFVSSAHASGAASPDLSNAKVQTPFAAWTLASVGTFTLTYTAGTGGSISGDTVQTVYLGMNGTEVTAVPANGYLFVRWSDGVTTATRRETYVTGNVAVTAVFDTTTSRINVATSAHGVVQPGTTVVNRGSDFWFSAVPDAGYQLKTMLVDGSPVRSDATTASISLFVLRNVTGPSHQIAATFEPVDPGDLSPMVGKPIIVLVPGWMNNGDDGEMAGLHKILAGEPYNYTVLVAPSTIDPHWDDVIDSDGNLENNIWRLANWLGEEWPYGQNVAALRTHPFIIIGHSYGGVMSRGLVSRSAADTIGGTQYWKHPEIRANLRGVIQLGSPNEGSPLADKLESPGASAVFWLAKLFSGLSSSATKSMSTQQMAKWNSKNQESTRPIQRAAGSFLPAVFDEELRYQKGGEAWPGYWYQQELAPKAYTKPAEEGLHYLDDALGHQVSDGFVTRTSAISKDAYFKGGGYKTFPELRHSGIIPGEKLVERKYTYEMYLRNNWLNPIAERTLPPDGHWHWTVVPGKVDVNKEATRNWVLDYILYSLQNPARRWVEYLPGSTQAIRQTLAAPAAPADPAVDEGSLELPHRVLTLGAGSTAPLELKFDGGPLSLNLSSKDASPVLVAISPNASVDTTTTSWQADDGTYVTSLEMAPHGAGTRTLSVSLGDRAGVVDVTGSAASGPRLCLTVATDSPATGRAVEVRARVASGAVVPGGVSVSGTLEKDGAKLPVEMRDDGVAPDAVSGDGQFTGRTDLTGTPGDWYAAAEAQGADFERSARVSFSAGSSQWARFVRAVETTTEAGEGGTIARWGIASPVDVTESGDYSVSCDVVDASGRLVAQPASWETLPAGAAVVPTWVEGSELSGIQSGALHVTTVRLSKFESGRPLSVETTVGPISAPYSASSFEDFSLDLNPSFSSPTSTADLSFHGSARYTPGSVSTVEYSLDGGSTWSDATASDGAFDGKVEGFDIALSPGDGLYGLLVRSRTDDGKVLAAENWGVSRFVVDTTAPGAATGVSALPDVMDPTIADVSWTAPEAPSSSAAQVSYEVSVDMGLATRTRDTTVSVELPDLAGHVIRVRPVDEAGNAGPYSVLDVGDSQAPTTTCDAKATYAGSATITLSPVDSGTGIAQTIMWLGADSSSPTSGTVTVVKGAGAYSLHYLSIDRAGNREDTRTANFAITPAQTPKPVYRFRNLHSGFYLWSADESEKASIIANLSRIWFYEGVAYRINTANASNTSPLWRFVNIRGGFYLYTADPAEKASIQAKLASVWRYEGPAYNVSRDASGKKVYRFRNKKDGTYLYSADESEKDTIVRTLTGTWQLEGPAYYLAP